MGLEAPIIGALLFALLIFLILFHFPIGIALGATGVIGVTALAGWGPALQLLATEPAGAFSNKELALLPLFILMGTFASAAGLSGDLYRLINSFLGHFRGGLTFATIGACAGFGAVCGSSLATAATMSRVALPEMTSRGYEPGLAAGSIAAGGTLGMLIPPSIVMVVYGFLTDQFILTLFAAALIPGLIAVLFHFLSISVLVRLRPDAAPRGERMPWRQRFAELYATKTVVILVILVAGGIYSGVFTVNESAAIGTVFTFTIWAYRSRFDSKALWQVLFEAGSTTAVIYLVIVGAQIFTYALTLSELPEVLVHWIGSLDVAPIVVVFLFLAMYIVLGSIFETISAMVITLPFVFPVIVKLGLDPIWWGVINVMVIEIGMITPPIGLNVFVLHKMAPHVPLKSIFRGTLPFLGADIVRLVLLTVAPAITLWLPKTLGLMK